MTMHSGHRERLRRRFAEDGLDTFDDVNALELLLFYAIPRQDTNAAAHALLDTFGTLDRVLEAGIADLQRVEGIGYDAAVYLHLVSEICRRDGIARAREIKSITSAELAGRYVLPLFEHQREELLYLVCLDAACRVLSCRLLSRGAANSAEVSVRAVIECALSQNAAKAIIAHNHPHGLAMPSREDEEATYRLANALHVVEIELLDHIIVANGSFISMAECGALPQYGKA